MLDHDGVVVDSLEVFSTSFIVACRRLGIAAVETHDDVLALFEGNVYECLRAAGADDAQVVEAVRRSAAALRRALPWLHPFPLMPQVLEELAEARHVVIVTSNDEELVTAFLRRHHINGVPEVASAPAGQGKVEKIRRLIARFPGQEKWWFVSSTAGEVRDARAAGATPLGVAWGWHDPELLTAAGAERIAAAPADLLAIVAPELSADFLGAG
jgi:phosphoglycolate phosphatase